MDLFGATRTVVAARHAVIAPDSHVPSNFPDWAGATAYVMISPAMGADFSQILLTFAAAGGVARFPADEHEHAIYVEAGTVRAAWQAETRDLAAGDFLFTPETTMLELAGDASTRITIFRKQYEWIAGIDPPPAIYGSASAVPSEPFLGHENALLQVLLPADVRYDLAMNIFTYQPGATLPFVETHIMEHGLLMLSGQGIYRLEERYHPVKAGDAIWMAPYCPQWFVAMGTQPASYLYYKDVNRLP